MLRICSRTLVRRLKPCSSAKLCHSAKPVSTTAAAGRSRTQKNDLPTLPVPPLKQSCEIYLSMLEPILEGNELKHTKKLVEDFVKEGGIGEKLQRGLERKACDTENWLTENYVNHFYLHERKPVVIFSNIGAIFPRLHFLDKQAQIRFAAEFTVSLLNIKTLIDNGTLPGEYLGRMPLCMEQYRQVFSSCRKPGLKTDSLMFYGKSSNPPKHITVVHNCQFFQVDAYNSDGTLLTVDQLCVQLEKVCNSSLETNTEPVGILTTQHRDIWSKAYLNLIKDETNKESMSAIESSILTVCLDKAMPPTSDELYRCSAILQIVHGGGSQCNSGNRWFDKGLQVIVAEDGTSGANGAHSVADGSVFGGLGDHALAQMKKASVMPSPIEPLPEPKKLHFNVTPDIKEAIEEAKQHLDTLTQDLDLRATAFKHFGKNVIKVHKISPDAFVQLGLQLAYYRLYRRCCSLYEPASLRMFRLGRVGGIHSNTNASAAFVKAFDDPQKQNSEKVHLLEQAIKIHKMYTKMAVSGQAIEGHFVGLKQQAVEQNIPLPELFTDISFAKAFQYQMSTSQIISMNGMVPCVAPESRNTYDVCYSIMKDHIDLIVSRVEDSNKENKTGHLIKAVEDALLDMKTLLEQTPRA